MADTTARIYRWNREAYDRAVDSGVFGPADRIELIDGEIVEVTPQGSRHAAAVIMVAKVVERAFAGGCHVRDHVAPSRAPRGRSCGRRSPPVIGRCRSASRNPSARRLTAG